MHFINRVITLLVLTIGILPLGTYALLSLGERNLAEESLKTAIQMAVGGYGRRKSLSVLRTQAEGAKEEQEHALLSINNDLRESRLSAAKLQRVIRDIEERYAISLPSSAAISSLVEKERPAVTRVVRDVYMQKLATGEGEEDVRAQLRGVFVSPLQERRASAEAQALALATRMQYLKDLLAANRAMVDLEDVLIDREELLSERADVQARFDSAQTTLHRSKEQIEEIARIMEDVHEQVLALQDELARIDARLKRKAERNLLEKGLLDPRPREGNPLPKLAPRFHWPAYGPISAGFLDARYERYFGIPHHGMDIVIDQESPVYAAADGIVFLVRDGGEKGYTYVLVGHRDGYATLYGHLFAVAVHGGEEVSGGQMIGLSGGRPGTHGAGPLTTNPHLHFEVLKNGVNVDPKGVLP